MKVICKYLWLKIVELVSSLISPFVDAYNKMKEETDNA